MTFGERLKELRDQKKITQEDFAAAIGFNRSTLANWETDRALPDILTCNKIADYFQVSTDYLLGRCDTPWPSHVDGKIKEGALPFNISFKEVKPGEFEIDFGDFMSKDDITFYKKYKQLTPEQKKILEMMADQMLGKEVPRKGD